MFTCRMHIRGKEYIVLLRFGVFVVAIQTTVWRNMYDEG